MKKKKMRERERESLGISFILISYLIELAHWSSKNTFMTQQHEVMQDQQKNRMLSICNDPTSRKCV